MEEYLFQNGRKCPQLKGHIFLVDDDEDDQLIFLTVVEKLCPELRCTTAWNGIDAINRLSQIDPLPEIIFLDLNMPLMNGHQFLTEIRKNEKFGNVPIVVLSTSSHLPSQDKALQLGAWHFLTKPSSLSEWEQQLMPILTAKPGIVSPVNASHNG
jgi:FOG: CheY-like receiver